MNVFQSPIDENLSFGYVSYGILNRVNNLWTWVTFVAAAVSFWRIRAAGARAASFSVKCDPPASTTSSFPQKVREIPRLERPSDKPVVQTSTPAVAASSEAIGDFEVKGVARGKFTVHYEDEGETDGNLTAVKEWEYKESEVLCGEWWENWERVLRTRRGEVSWYRSQDLTVLNGNVVRLWDGVWKGEYSTSGAVW